MDKYAQKDEKGRIEFEKFCNNNKEYKILKFATQQYSHWDVAFKHFGKNVVGEIKSRNISSTTYNNMMIEVTKFNNLIKIAKEKGCKAYYINHFSDGETYIWDITNLSLKSFVITKKLLPLNDFDQQLVWKEVFYLIPRDRINLDLSFLQPDAETMELIEYTHKKQDEELDYLFNNNELKK
jgi:hypothetical protein